MEERRRGFGRAFWISGLCALVPLVCVAVPMVVIRPFVPQEPHAMEVALALRRIGPFLSAMCLVMSTVILMWGMFFARRTMVQVGLTLFFLISVAGVWATRFNLFEKMFHPYEKPAFGGADAAGVEPDDKVLAVRFGGEARAYPIRTMGYHHIVNDTVGGAPIAVTYCTLCHTGLVWSRRLDGRLLTFRLAGINNGNALLRDEQTGSIWQQSTGEAIFGALKGKHLELVHSDELTFALWKKEQPAGQVLRPDTPYLAEYETKDWEKRIVRRPLVVDTRASGIDGHVLMLAVEAGGRAKAFPLDKVLAAKVVQDEVGGVPVMLMVGSDAASVRVFRLGAGMTMVREGDAVEDVETKSVWDFRGCAVSGARTGDCLQQVEAHKDFWFDWMQHHRETAVWRG